MALRSRRILPTISTLVNNHVALSSFASISRLPEPLKSTTSPVVQFQSRLFRSSPISMLCSTSPANEEKVDEKINPNDIIFAGCDYNHWLITIDFPKDPKPTAEEMVETYVQTCAKGLNISEEEAKKRIYACSTTTYKGFQAVMSEEESEQFRALPNVIFILPDSYIDHVKKEYGGDKYVNGTIIPRHPPPQQKRFQGQTDRNMGRDNRSYGPPRSYAQQNRRNYPPQGGMQNSGPATPPHVGDCGPGDFVFLEDLSMDSSSSSALAAPIFSLNTGRHLSPHFNPLDHVGVNFRRWKNKMHFLLTSLKVVHVLSTPMPVAGNAPIDAIRKRSKWENDDYICRGHILNGMSNPLFDVYQNIESAKELWDAIEAKYMREDASSKKFLVSNLNSYKMVDSRPVTKQFNELTRILRQFAQYNMKMDDSIAVSSIIDKLPPLWKDFKHKLKHKKEETSLEELGGELQVEE
ncbi:unnamed protein product [Rhodiola kirilowii]